MTSRDAPAGTCVSCGGQLERVDELTLDIAGQDVPFYTDRCGVCLSEFVTAPDIFRDDAELLNQFRTRGPIGSPRRILSLTSRERGTRPPPGSRVAATLLGHMLEHDMADVVFLAHQGVAEEPVVAFTKRDLVRVGEIRTGKSRAIFTGSQRRSNLLTLAQHCHIDVIAGPGSRIHSHCCGARDHVPDPGRLEDACDLKQLGGEICGHPAPSRHPPDPRP